MGAEARRVAAVPEGGASVSAKTTRADADLREAPSDSVSVAIFIVDGSGFFAMPYLSRIFGVVCE